MINALFYLKERITAIEKTAMTASPFRSVSPKGHKTPVVESTKFGQSMGTTSAASQRQEGRDQEGRYHEGRDNPFN